MDQGNVVALQHNAAHRFAVLALRVVLFSVVQDQVHVLIETNYVAYKTVLNFVTLR